MNLSGIGIVGTGFVADLYMRSLQTFAELRVVKAYDVNQGRLAEFCRHWGVSVARSLNELLRFRLAGPHPESHESEIAFRNKPDVP